MDNQSFDRNLREKAEQHHPPVPSDMWDRIMASRKKKKRALGWWKVAGIIFFLTAGGGYLGYKHLNENQTAEKISEKAAQPAAADDAHKLKDDGENDAIHPADEMNNNEIENPSSAPEAIAKAESVKKISAPVKKSESIAAYLNIPAEENNVNTSTEPKGQGKNQPENADENITPSETREAGINTEITEAEKVAEATPAAAAKEESEKDTEQQAAAEEEKILKPGIKIIPEYSLEMIASPDVSFKYLDTRSGDQSRNYKTMREESEKHDYAYSFNLYFRADLTDHLFVRTGIQYVRIYERFSITITERYIADIIIDTLLKGMILDPFQPPQPYFLLDTIYDYKFHEFQFAADNRYQFVNIPVSIGLKTTLSSFDLYATAGVLFSIAASASGNIIAPDSLYLLTLQNQKDSPYRSKTGISGSVSLGVAYHLGTRISFLFEPSFRMNLKSITKEEYPLKQKYAAAGFGMGIKYDF